MIDLNGMDLWAKLTLLYGVTSLAEVRARTEDAEEAERILKAEYDPTHPLCYLV